MHELYWSTNTHHFHDCSPASTLGFETVLHIACRLDFTPVRSTGHRTRGSTSKPTHLPLELWHYILSFLRRSDLDPDEDARLKLDVAPVNDVNASLGFNIAVTPLILAVGVDSNRNDPDSAEYAILKMLLDCPSLEKNSGYGHPLQTAIEFSAQRDGEIGLHAFSEMTKLMLHDPDVNSSRAYNMLQSGVEVYDREHNGYDGGGCLCGNPNCSNAEVEECTIM